MYAHSYPYKHIFFTGTFRLKKFISRSPPINIYHIYRILKMPSNGFPAAVSQYAKVPKTRNFGTKNSKLGYHFLDGPRFWLQYDDFDLSSFVRVPISRNS